MHLLLTDRLTCPRCGPTFGLILRADDLVDRRVRAGVLGCPNCRDSFAIEGGVADLRAPPRGAFEEGLAGATAPSDTDPAEPSEGAMALLGVARGPGTIALVGSPARYAPSFARAIEDVGLVAIDPDVRFWDEHPGVSRVVCAPGLPFFDRVLRGVVIDGRAGLTMLHEAARVVAPGARVVVVEAGSDGARILREGGLTVLAEEGETVVAARG